MYESPIEIIYSPIRTKVDDDVVKVVQNYGINVNKEELIKALRYDRQQYKKGYEDAKAERKIGEWIWDENGMDWGLGAWCCSECRNKAETWWASDKKYNPLRCAGGRFCGNCGADMRGESNESN